MLIDVDENDNIVLYTDTLKPYRNASESSEKGMRVMYKSEGKSLFEAVRNMNLTSSYVINYSQNKAVIFSERAAEKGLQNYIDFLNRDQEFNVRSFLFIYYGDIKRIMKLAANNEEYMGSFLNEIVNKMQTSPRTVHLNLNDYIVNRNIGSGVTIMSALEVRKEVLEDKIKLVGGAIIKDEKLSGKLFLPLGLSYNLLTNKVKKGTLEVINPGDKEKLATLEILKGNTKTKIEYNKGKIQLIKNIKIHASLGEVQGNMNLTKENVHMLEKSAKDNIEKYGVLLFEEYKNKDIDLFNVSREIEKKYPHVKIEDILKNTVISINAEVKIEGSSRIQNAE